MLKQLLFLALLITAGNYSIFGQITEKPNVIFIIIDDLNDYTETLGGHPQAITPGITRIEQLGTTFLNAHTTSPKCAPSRTSFVTGKDLAYTQVYKNPACRPFRDYFTPGMDNEEVYTMPEYMKDSGGYFTYGLNKIYHCFDSEYDFDFETDDPCEKSLSWNKYSLFFNGDDTLVNQYGNDHNDGVGDMAWSKIPDGLESIRYDHRLVDSASNFIQNYVNDPSTTCDKPFFMMLGFRKPHLAWFIPEMYYSSHYMDDAYATPFNYPYNIPNNAYPYNGIVMPPQPDTIYNDFNNLPAGGLGQYVALYDSIFARIEDEADIFIPLPEIDPGLTDPERKTIIENSIRANAVMAYLAAARSVDAQINRLMDTLEAYPEIYSNSIIVLLSDHGYSLGEKKHWQKGGMWETDLRVPLVIADLRNPIQQQINNPASLLDVFPTLCEMTETPYPVFADGSDYLDGKSLYPMLNDPTLKIDKPSLSSYKEHTSSQASCFPMHSVRNSNFHYIVYTSNNADWILECDGQFSWHEEELYEIGTNREIDPNEWNNLINDADYRPMVDYLQQWLPDSAMYLQIPFTAEIQHNTIDCLLSYDDTLQLSIALYDTTGVMMLPPENYVYAWTNNLTADTIFGTSAEFLMQSIPEDVFDSEQRILFFMQMLDTANRAVVAIANEYFYLNPDLTPIISFNVSADSLTVSVTDVLITGVYQSVTWDFDDGFITNELNPLPHTYAVNGSYNIKCTVAYSYDETCVVQLSKLIRPIINDFYTGIIKQILPPVIKKNVMHELRGDEISVEAEEYEIKIYPNPASNSISINGGELSFIARTTIYNILGEAVYDAELIFESGSSRINVVDLPPGTYLLKLSSNVSTRTSVFEIIR